MIFQTSMIMFHVNLQEYTFLVIVGWYSVRFMPLLTLASLKQRTLEPPNLLANLPTVHAKCRLRRLDSLQKEGCYTVPASKVIGHRPSKSWKAILGLFLFVVFVRVTPQKKERICGKKCSLRRHWLIPLSCSCLGFGPAPHRISVGKYYVCEGRPFENQNSRWWKEATYAYHALKSSWTSKMISIVFYCVVALGTAEPTYSYG